jgi:hypothetical protein
MAKPPPNICRKIRKLHAMLGSPNDNERETTRKKLDAVLAEYSLTWNDIPEILAAVDTGGASRQAPPQQQPADDDLPDADRAARC